MNKSSRSSMAAAGTNRRFSQPVFAGSSSSDRSRRGSEMPSNARGGDSGPGTQYDDKLTVVEAKGPRKPRNKDGMDIPSFDPDHYNPDGSLRTIHKMPNFNDAYAEASKARYVRHKALLDREKELSVNQIFEDS